MWSVAPKIRPIGEIGAFLQNKKLSYIKGHQMQKIMLSVFRSQTLSWGWRPRQTCVTVDIISLAVIEKILVSTGRAYVWGPSVRVRSPRGSLQEKSIHRGQSACWCPNTSRGIPNGGTCVVGFVLGRDVRVLTSRLTSGSAGFLQGYARCPVWLCTPTPCIAPLIWSYHHECP